MKLKPAPQSTTKRIHRSSLALGMGSGLLAVSLFSACQNTSAPAVAKSPVTTPAPTASPSPAPVKSQDTGSTTPTTTPTTPTDPTTGVLLPPVIVTAAPTDPTTGLPVTTNPVTVPTVVATVPPTTQVFFPPGYPDDGKTYPYSYEPESWPQIAGGFGGATSGTEYTDLVNCINTWNQQGGSPFVATNLPPVKTFAQSFNFFGFGNPPIDETITATPQLIYVPQAWNFFTSQTYILGNPNGWYCVGMTGNLASNLNVELDCASHMSGGGYNFTWSGTGAPTATNQGFGRYSFTIGNTNVQTFGRCQ